VNIDAKSSERRQSDLRLTGAPCYDF